MKKLIPAICLMLVTAMLVGTSTYAWFTMNTQVTATGMQVKATSGGNLLIAYSADGSAPADSDFKVGDTANMTSASSLAPASTQDLTTFVYNTAASVSAASVSSGANYTAVPSGGSGYYVKQTFYLKAGQDMSVYMSSLSIKVNGTEVATDESSLWNSLRVGVLTYDGTSGAAGTKMIYANTAASADGAYDTDGKVAGTGTDANAVGASTNGKAALNTTGKTDKFHAVTEDKATDAAVICAKLTANTKTKVEVFIWFEGEDATCYTNNLKVDDVAIEFQFADANAS